MVHLGVRWHWSLVVLTAVIVAVVGCNKPAPPPPAPNQDSQDTKSAGNTAGEARFRQPFADATRKDPPNDFPPPPDVTLTGKSVGKIYEQVIKAWDDIPFVTEAGQRIVYHAILDTELGAIEIELRPDWAPNHVRSFIALARVGYYDSLTFEQTLHEEQVGDDGEKRVLDQIQGGCPLGTGDLYQGNIGYWLKDEIDEKNPVTHEAGVIGACRSEEPDSDGCGFSITLNKAPFLDGHFTVFGKVSQGLDVARNIWAKPTIETEDPFVPSRPVKPVVIRKMTISAKEVDKPGPGGDN